MGIFETHAHYTDDAFNEDRDEVLNSMKDNNVDYIVEIGDNIDRSIRAVKLAKKYNFMYAAVGIHPEQVDDVTEDDYIKLTELLDRKEENKIVAVGEIGLDYYYTKDNKEKQIELFRRQLDIALKYNMPCVIHTRDASQDTFEIVKEYAQKGLKAIIHCFSESLELANEYVKLGMLIGVGGVLTFKNGKKLVQVVENLDMNNFVLETDSPYLAPEPNRGTRNDSRNIKYVAEKMAEIKGISYDEILDITSKNAKEFYNIK